MKLQSLEEYKKARWIAAAKEAIIAIGPIVFIVVALGSAAAVQFIVEAP